MHITLEPKDEFTVLHLRGEFDTFYTTALQKEIEGLIAGGVVHVVLNLRLVKFINSTALGSIIKASKSLSSNGGKLVMSRPSAFCREIIEKVGLDRVVAVFDTDEAAGASLTAGVAQAHAPAASDSDDGLDDEAAVIFTLVDQKRLEHFVPQEDGRPNPVHSHTFGKNWRGIGRMSGLDSEGLRFTWNGGKTKLSAFEMGQLLALGTELRVKFRLPLLQKGHCEAVVTIDEVEERAEGVKVGSSFSEIEDETRQAVQQYSADMAFLKNELRQATENES